MEDQKTILVVDDDAAIRDMLRSILESPTVRIFEADTCAKAVKYACCVRFDAILLDNSLPDGEGVNMVYAISRVCPRVIMITADESRIRQQALLRGAEEVFPKPFNACRLMVQIDEGW